MVRRKLSEVRATGLNLTDEARRLINLVRIEQSLSQCVLADKIGTVQSSIAKYLNGTHTVTPALCGALYDALGKDERLEFLSYFAKKDYSKHKTYLVDVTQLHSERPAYILNPFYERIDEVYRAAPTKAKCGIISELEKLILRYEQGSIVPQTTNKEPPTTV